MSNVLEIALSFPSIVYTVLLGVSLVYWLFVMVGAAHLDLLGDGAAEGAIDGAVKGAIEGAVDGAVKGAMEGAADGLDGHAGEHGEIGDHGGLAGMLAALKLRSAPATVVLSVLVLFSWLFSVLGMQAAAAILPGVPLFAKIALFVVAPILALPVTSLVIRPMARLFVHHDVTVRQDLVGKVCTIRTGTVTDKFGEASLEDGGAGLVVRVRIETGDDAEKLKRGDQAVIVGYDDERQEFTVAPLAMDALLRERAVDDER
ncbi:MAG: DUF1449 family protein [Labilithrix sp.]|nr:DUF1449 family protein [Labilithrix sp.]